MGGGGGGVVDSECRAKMWWGCASDGRKKDLNFRIVDGQIFHSMIGAVSVLGY